MSRVFTNIFEAPPLDRKEILRYAGVKSLSEETELLLDECLAEVKNTFSYKVCYAEFDITTDNNEVDLGFAKVLSTDLSRNLFGCSGIILFAATVGAGIDRLIARYSLLSPAKALIFQAIGTERIESLCNLFNEKITKEKAAEGYITKPRFSPGYGNLDIRLQNSIISALDCHRQIGIALNDSLLMFPSKSVTAIIGLKKQD